MPSHEPEVQESRIRDYRAECIAALRSDGCPESSIERLADEAVLSMRMAQHNARVLDMVFALFDRAGPQGG